MTLCVVDMPLFPNVLQKQIIGAPSTKQNQHLSIQMRKLSTENVRPVKENKYFLPIYFIFKRSLLLTNAHNSLLFQHLYTISIKRFLKLHKIGVGYDFFI